MTRKVLLGLLVAFSLGCGESGTTETSSPAETSAPEATPAAFNVAGAPTVEFSVPDMMCEESCAKAVHDTLAAQPGAVEVVVDFPNRLATVAIEEGKFDSHAALDALFDKQFSEAKLVGAEEESTTPAEVKDDDDIEGAESEEEPAEVAEEVTEELAPAAEHAEGEPASAEEKPAAE